MSRLPLVVVGRFPPPFDGQALATRRCASLLHDARDVRVVNTEPPGSSAHQTDPVFSVRRSLAFLGVASQIRRAIAEAPGAPVLWHSISPSGLGHLRDLLTTLPALGRKSPVYAVLHRGTFDQLFASPKTRWTAARLRRRVTAFVFLSDVLSDRCTALPASQKVVIPLTVDEELLVSAGEAGAKTARGPQTPPRLLFLSHMIREKGYLDVLEAVVQLRDRGVHVHLDLAGGWPSDADRQAFEARVSEAGLGAAVQHHGAISDRNVARQLHLGADVFLLPTVHPTEAQPVSILEALGAATPVIATDRSILRDLVGENGAGIFVGPHAPDEIARAVERILQPARWARASAAARARFESAFAPDVVRSRWLSLVG